MDELKNIAGQRLMIGFDGTVLTDNLKRFIKDYRLGGVILFARNIENPKQISELCSTIQQYAVDCGLPALFIAIDQEGGTVARLPKPFTQFPNGAPALKTHDRVVHFAEITSVELNASGVNMDMAPVLDIAPEGFGSFMERRALGRDPQTVAELGVTMLKTFQSHGIIPVGKHFPGIGRTILDSHFELPVFDEDLQSLTNFDLIPFKVAIDEGLEAVMLSHILYNKLDAKNPASMSKKIVEGLLRHTMGFGGVVMTDDLDMGAISENYGFSEAVQKAIDATVDIMLVCHESKRIDETFDILLSHAQTNTSAAKECYNRIMNLKQRYALA